MRSSQVQFSILSHAAWAPDLTTQAHWLDWAEAPFVIQGEQEPRVAAMPAMLRRRAGFLGKMALEVAYQCLDGRKNIPAVFCSRHGDVGRALTLLNNVVDAEPMSPTSFALAVHNANAGLFSIARADQASHSAMAAGPCTVEYGVIEACSLLADGAEEVLLVAYDNCLPGVYAPYLDCIEQPHAWAWLMTRPQQDVLRLSWSASDTDADEQHPMPASLRVWQCYLCAAQQLQRHAARRTWCWSKNG